MVAAFLYWSVKVSPHVHYLGAGAPSFGENIRIHHGDVVEISFEGLGRLFATPCTPPYSAEYHPVRDSSFPLP